MPKRNYYKKVHNARTARNKKLLIAALVFFGIGLPIIDRAIDKLILGDMGAVKYERMQTHHDNLVAEIAKYKQDNARLIRKVAALKTNLDYIEIVARDKLGLARPGEIIYYYNPE